MQRRFALVLAGAASLAGLAGCGFTLRQALKLQFSSLAFKGFDLRSPLEQALRQAISAQVPVLADASRAAVVLQAFADKRERSVVASTASAQVRELQLRLRFEFTAFAPPDRELLPRSLLLLKRDLSTSEVATLAKEQEEAELQREMQADVVAQVMRRLASIRV